MTVLSLNLAQCFAQIFASKCTLGAFLSPPPPFNSFMTYSVISSKFEIIRKCIFVTVNPYVVLKTYFQTANLISALARYSVSTY